MDKKTFATMHDLAGELSVNKTKIMFLYNMGLFKADYVVSKKILIFKRDKALSTLRRIINLQKKGISLENIKSTLCEKNINRKN